MKTTIINFIVIIAFSTTFFSCADVPYHSKDFLPKASGDLGEVVVVLDKNYWQSEVSVALKDIFEEQIMSLPQPEPLMQMSFITKEGFGKGVNEHHSVLMIEIGDAAANEQAYLSKKTEDQFAVGQMSYTLRAPSVHAAAELLKENKTFLRRVFIEKTNEIIIADLKKTNSAAINNELGLTLGINMIVPNTFTIMANHSDFIWMQQLRQRYSEGQNHEIQVGIMCYTYPYIDSLAFTQERILDKRDSITKKYIKGFIDSSYMKLERTYGLEYEEKTVNEHYVFENKGVWKMQKAMMGGPFVSMTIYDEKRSRIVVLDGYVYAPHFRKMEYLREVEAILYSYSFVE